MRCKVFFVLFAAVFLGLSCDIFDSDGSNKDEIGFETTSMPKNLKGKWYHNNYYLMEITSTKVYHENREWNINTIAKKNDEHRLMLISDRQYMAVYFSSITETTCEKSFGDLAYSLYQAKVAGREGWETLTKK